MPIIIDQLAQLDLAWQDSSSESARLRRALADDSFWVEVSGAGRLTKKRSKLEPVMHSMGTILDAAPERYVLGVEWPPVNLPRKNSAVQLADLLIQVAGNDRTLERVLFCKSAQLYGLDLEVA